MPRVSKRAKAISHLAAVFNHRMRLRAMRMMEDEEDDSSVEHLKDLAAAMSLKQARNKRYLFRPSKYRKSPAPERFATDLQEDASVDSNGSSQMPWLTDDEFLQKYRVTRAGFQYILNRIKDHPIFESKTKTMAPPEHQLMVFLKYVGTEGSGANGPNQRNTFGCGKGTSVDYRRRVTTALKALKKQYIKWPDEERRQVISKSIQKDYDFPHCIGIADGTLFPLAFEPQTEDAPDYSGRKYGYSLSTMIVCDHTR
jgi:hypothetical protein